MRGWFRAGALTAVLPYKPVGSWPRRFWRRGGVCGEGTTDLLWREVGTRRGDAGLVPPRGSTSKRDTRTRGAGHRWHDGDDGWRPKGTPCHGSGAIAAVPGWLGRAVNPTPATAGGGRGGQSAETVPGALSPVASTRFPPARAGAASGILVKRLQNTNRG